MTDVYTFLDHHLTAGVWNVTEFVWGFQRNQLEFERKHKLPYRSSRRIKGLKLINTNKTLTLKLRFPHHWLTLSACSVIISLAEAHLHNLIMETLWSIFSSKCATHTHLYKHINLEATQLKKHSPWHWHHFIIMSNIYIVWRQTDR